MIGKKERLSILAFAVFFAAFGAARVVFADAAADAEKAKALAEPYANDLGPEKLDAKTLKSYPPKVRAGYKMMLNKCTVCHSASRPLNSQFIEAKGKKKVDRKAEVAKMKKKDPSLFKGKDVWQIEDSIWKRFVKRMMSKPGCEINKEEAKSIWTFLSHDSRARKLGKNKKEWGTHRRKLLSKLKNHKNPKFRKRYAQLYEKHKKKKGGTKKK